jgi:hypothetical protein
MDLQGAKDCASVSNTDYTGYGSLRKRRTFKVCQPRENQRWKVVNSSLEKVRPPAQNLLFPTSKQLNRLLSPRRLYKAAAIA